MPLRRLLNGVRTALDRLIRVGSAAEYPEKHKQVQRDQAATGAGGSRGILVFFSRVTNEFGDYDEVLRSTLATLPSTSFKTPSDIQGYESGYATLDKLWDYLLNADAVVHLVGERLGHCPPESMANEFLDRHPELKSWTVNNKLPYQQWSFTQWEVYLAKFRLHRSGNGFPRIFVCRHKKPVLRNPLENEGPYSGSSGPISNHLVMLSALNIHANITFHCEVDLLNQLLLTAFGALVHRGSQETIITLSELVPSLHRSPAGKALLSWPQLTTSDDKGRWLERKELQPILEQLSSGNQSVTLLLGPPGSGKSALLARIADQCRKMGLMIVPIKADSVSESVSTSDELARELGLPEGTDLVTSVRRLAADGPVVVLMDQLDALARLAVLKTARLRLLIEVINRLSNLENVHVVASCRTYEQQHDPLLRLIDAKPIQLGLPPWEQVEEVLALYKLNPKNWNQQLKETLRNPQALSIFITLTSQAGDTPIASNYRQMLDQLWDERILSDGTGKLSKMVMEIAELLSDQEELWLPLVRFDEVRPEIDDLVARDILRIESGRVGFRHQTLFEHARARSAAQDFRSLVDTARSKQVLLRARPQIWHGLNYLRDVDRSAYHQALRALWTDRGLRKHLRMLLVDFMGMQQVPTLIEVGFLLAALEEDEWRDRVLISMVGSKGWFEKIRDENLARLMRETNPEKQGPLRQLLVAAFDFDQNSAVNMIRANWMPEENRTWLAWNILTQVSDWSAAVVDDLITIASSIDIADIWIDNACATVSVHLPVEAPRLLRAWLNRELIRADQEEGVSDRETDDQVNPIRKRYSDVLNRAKLYTACEIARAAPEAFASEIWPWFFEAAEAISYAPSSGRNVYPFSVLNVDFSDEEDRPGEHDLVDAMDVSICEWARLDPEGFLTFIRETEMPESLLGQRILSRGICQLVPAMPEIALEFLLKDPRRFALGPEYSAYTETWALVSSMSPLLEASDRKKLEEAILGWESYLKSSEDDDEARELKGSWGRQQKLLLMRQVPEPLRSDAFTDSIGELENEFPNLKPEGRQPTIGSAIGSPVSVEQMEKMPDDQLRSIIANYPDSTGWSHPNDFMKGGSIQLSSALAELAKQEPLRIMKMVLCLSVTDFVRPAGQVLRALSEVRPAEEVFEFAKMLLEKGFDSDGFRADFSYAMEKAASPDSVLPESIIQVMNGWLGSREEEPGFEFNDLDQMESLIWAQGGMRAVSGRGNRPILSALTRNFRLTKPPQWDRWIELFEEHLERRGDPAVWAAMSWELQFLSYVERERAANFVDRLLANHPELFSSRDGARLLYSTLRWAGEDDILRWLRSLLEYDHAQANQSAGELLVLRHLWFPFERETDGLLDVAMATPTGLARYPEALQVGMAYTAAEAWRINELRPVATDLWTRLLPTGSVKIERALSRIFRFGNEGVFFKDQYTRSTLQAILENPSILAQQSAEHLIDHLGSLLRDDWEPVLIGNVAIALADQVGDTLADVQTAWPLSAAALTDIVQLLQESPVSDAKTLGVDLMEKLLEFNLPEALDMVTDLDMRLTGSRQPRLPRRRRRRRNTKHSKAKLTNSG